MKRNLLRGLVVGFICSLALLPMALKASCVQGSCWECFGQVCIELPIPGKCSCEDGVAQGGGRYCVAGGGTCVTYY